MKPGLIVLIIAAALGGAEPAAYRHWSAAELVEKEDGLAPKMNAQKVASQRIGDFGNHYALVLHREGSGEAEFHQQDADLLVIQSGTGTLIVGGTIRNSHATTPGEVRGASIDGGGRQAISAGDIVHVPSKTPHQIVLDKGQQLNYFTMKIKD
jgi:mannose-6-phosphate isomerase-like protein (cupin superfamily)